MGTSIRIRFVPHFAAMLASLRARFRRVGFHGAAFRQTRSVSLGTILTVCGIGIAIAGTGYADFLAAVAQRESSMNPNAVNRLGYVGLFQMGTMAMTDAGYYTPNGTRNNSWQGSWTGKGGVTSLSQLESNPDLQIQAVNAYYQRVEGYISSYGLNQYVGQTIDGVLVTQSGLVAGAHLVGIGELQRYLNSGGAYVPKDGNGVPITQYIQQFAGYSLSGPAPTYATLRAATPTGGEAASPYTPPAGGGWNSSGGGNGFGGLPNVGTDPDAGFANGAGVSMGQVGETIKLMLAATIFLWLGWAVLGNWNAFRKGRGIHGVTASPLHFARENLRAIGVMALCMWIIL